MVLPLSVKSRGRSVVCRIIPEKAATSYTTAWQKANIREVSVGYLRGLPKHHFSKHDSGTR